MESECFLCGGEVFKRTSGMRLCDDCMDEFDDGVEMTIYKKVRIEIAHYLNGHPTCGKVHGHSVDIVVGVKGYMDYKSGMVMDFKSLKEIIKKEIVDRFDHSFLNDILPMPTAEYLALYLFKKLESRGIDVALVRVHETENNYVEFCGRDGRTLNFKIDSVEFGE